ncbi:MAG: hypothetical protein HUJ54_07075 [Erysipelotrichaceae bacterium]|nr:hypothetical protein [Erysipelotrichaceae bacterium]
MEKRNAGRLSEPNGFALMPALMMFSLVVAVCALCALSLKSKAWLMQAEKQSVFETALIRQAKKMAVENEGLRQCTPDTPYKKTAYVQIQGREVRFDDLQTCIEMKWEQNQKKVTARLYYSMAGTESFEYLRPSV